MKNADIKTGVRYIVIPTWYSASAQAKDPDKVTQNHGVSIATLTSLDRYKAERNHWISDSNSNGNAQDLFPKAEKGDKNWGYLVKDESNSRWYVLKPANIVGEADAIEKRWEAEALKQQAEAEQLQKEREERQRIARQRKDEATVLLDGVVRGLASIIGSRFDATKIENNLWRLENYHDATANITIPLDYLVTLQERYLEMKDQVDSY